MAETVSASAFTGGHSTPRFANVDVDPGARNDGNVLQKDASLGNLALASLTSPSSTPLLSLSARTATVMSKITEIVQLATSASSSGDAGGLLATDEKAGQTRDLSLEELRREYEDETIDRFLRVFARQVHEVQMPEGLPAEIPGKDDIIPQDIRRSGEDDIVLDIEDAGEEWRLEPEPPSTAAGKITQASDPQLPIAVVGETPSAVADIMTQATQTIKDNLGHLYVLLSQGQWHGGSPAEYIAMEWLVPYLPRPHRKTYQFTFSGMQRTTSRLYLACQPLYASFVKRMRALMMWKDPRRSAIYCTLFWVLWFFDLLLPLFFARLAYALIRRKVLPYPTAQELLERRNATTQADVMGSEIRAYLESNVIEGVSVKDAWKLFRLVTKGKKQKVKDMVEQTPYKETGVELREEEDSKRSLLAALEEIADFHERFANLCCWRDPWASTYYVIILGVIILVSLYIPAKYVIKASYAGAGVGFWFIPRLYLAIPLEHRCRIPPPLGNVPTDAEYAMNIISQRVAQGEQVLPPELQKRKNRNNTNGGLPRTNYSPSSSTTFNERNATLDAQDDEDDSIPEDNTEDKSRIRRFKEMVKGVMLVARAGRRDDSGENLGLLLETFPAKHRATMGILSLTSTSLLFYPMISSTATVSIPLSSIRGIKRTGRMGGLRIKYAIPTDRLVTSPRPSTDNAPTATHRAAQPASGFAINGESFEKEEIFGWVSGRDEVFAKLVGWGGRRWDKV